MKQCGKCKQKKQDTEFSKKGIGLQHWCRSCSNIYHREHYHHNKGTYIRKSARHRADKRYWVSSYKESNPCSDCGGYFPSECMDFDHVRGVKRGDVSALLNNGVGILADEMAKCALVCANCHRIRTARRVRGRWCSGLAYLPFKQKIKGSSPLRPTKIPEFESL